MMHGGMRQIAELPEERARNSTQVVGRLLGLLKPYRWLVLAALLLVLVSAGAQGVSPFLIGKAVDELILAGDKTGLAWKPWWRSLECTGEHAGDPFQIYYLSSAGQRLLADLRQQRFREDRKSVAAIFGKPPGR